MTQEERQLTERYLENSLTGIELSSFLDKLESNEEFRNEVSFYNRMVEAVRFSEDKRLAGLIENKISYHKPLVPFSLKLILAFLIITASGIAVWNYIGNDSAMKNNKYFPLDFFRKENNTITEIPVSVEKSSKSYKNKSESTVNVTEKIPESKIGPYNLDSGNFEKGNVEEIEVKKDFLLISFKLDAVELNEPGVDTKDTEPSFSEKTASKLNPKSDLPEETKNNSNSYFVEFWVSPVNYKGYKLYENKLILFGIEMPDAVRLYAKDDKLWMKYGDDFYFLEKSDNYESFVVLNEIPSSDK